MNWSLNGSKIGSVVARVRALAGQQLADVCGRLLKVKVVVGGITGWHVSGTGRDQLAAANGVDADDVGAAVRWLDSDTAEKVHRAGQVAKGVVNAAGGSLPWGDGGWRLIPAARLLDVIEALGPPKRSYEEVVADILARYDELKAAAKARCKGLWDEAWFPSAATMERRLRCDLRTEAVEPAPALGMLGAEIAEVVRGQVEEGVRAGLEEGVREIGAALDGVARSIAAKAAKVETDPDAVIKLKPLRDMAAALLPGLRKLNITTDAEVDKAIGAVERLVQEWAAPGALSGGIGPAIAGAEARKVLADLQAMFGNGGAA